MSDGKDVLQLLQCSLKATSVEANGIKYLSWDLSYRPCVRVRDYFLRRLSDIRRGNITGFVLDGVFSIHIEDGKSAGLHTK